MDLPKPFRLVSVAIVLAVVALVLLGLSIWLFTQQALNMGLFALLLGAPLLLTAQGCLVYASSAPASTRSAFSTLARISLFSFGLVGCAALLGWLNHH